MEKEAKQSDKESQPAESLLFATSKHSRPSSSSEGREIQRRPAAARQQGWDLFLRMMTRETNLRQSKGQARREVSSRRSSSPGPPTRR
uniref:Spermatogenesis associated 33 n=2 Tax=Mus musculus TaxID=10090 RepID=A0A1D5RLG4_MOUSE